MQQKWEEAFFLAAAIIRLLRNKKEKLSAWGIKTNPAERESKDVRGEWYTPTEKKRAYRYRQGDMTGIYEIESMQVCVGCCGLRLWYLFSLRTRPSGLENWPARTRVFISWLQMDRLLTLTTWPQQYQSDHLEMLAVRTVVHFSLWGYWTIYMPVTVHRLQAFPTQTVGGSTVT